MASKSEHIQLFEKYPKTTICSLLIIAISFCDILAGVIFIPKDMNNFRAGHHYYHHGMLPNKTGYSQWGDGAIYPVFTNSLGLIDSEVRNIELNISNKRIVFIGDSYTEGLGLPFDKTFVGIIKARFDNSNIDILNAAALSYSPKMYYLKIKYLIENVGLQFNELYVFLDISDIQDEILYRKYNPDEQTSTDLLIENVKRKLKNVSFLMYSINFLYQHEKVERQRKKYNAKYYPPWLDYFWLEDRDTTPYSDPSFRFIRSDWYTDMYFNNPWTQLGLKYAFEHMNNLLELCRSNNIKLSIAVYPWPAQIKRKELYSRQVSIWESYSAYNKIEFINMFPDFINNDLTPEEVNSKYFITGDVHWNLEGHKIVANKVARYLR